MPASYPAGIWVPLAPGALESSVPTHSTIHNAENAEIVAIEAELGVNPKGASATVAARFTDLDARYAPVDGAWINVPAATLVLNQGVAVAKTVLYAAYYVNGKTVHFQGQADVTGAGTASAVIQVGLPVPMRAGITGNVRTIGTGVLFDVSTNGIVRAIASPVGTFIQFIATNSTAANYCGAVDFAALAVGDHVCWDVEYESA